LSTMPLSIPFIISASEMSPGATSML
jgi:hypothetical protein